MNFKSITAAQAFNFFVFLLCSYNAVMTATQERWGWFALNVVFALLNFRIMLSPAYRWPKRFF